MKRHYGSRTVTGAFMKYTDEDAETAIYLALGAASMCWEPPPRGQYVSGQAATIGAELIEHLRTLRLLPDPPLPDPPPPPVGRFVRVPLGPAWKDDCTHPRGIHYEEGTAGQDYGYCPVCGKIFDIFDEGEAT